MTDFLGEVAYRGDFVILPERVSRNGSSLRFGIVWTADVNGCSICTPDGRVVHPSSDQFAVVPPHCVPDDIERQLEGLIGMV